jgi:hypothetical protein
MHKLFHVTGLIGQCGIVRQSRRGMQGKKENRINAKGERRGGAKEELWFKGKGERRKENTSFGESPFFAPYDFCVNCSAFAASYNPFTTR